MKVHCETCGTDFSLDEDRIPQEGAWVRCGICGEIFQVLPPEPEQPPEAAPEPEQPPEEGPEPELDLPPEQDREEALEPEPEPPAEAESEEGPSSTWVPPQPDPSHGPPRLGPLDLPKVQEAEAGKAQERAQFGLEERPAKKERPPRSPLFKIIFWLIGILLLAAVTALGAVVVMARLGVGHEVVDRVSGLPGMAMLMGKEQAHPAGKQAAKAPLLSLVEVKRFLKNNETVGKIFVIQGKVVNNSAQAQRSVLVQGTLHDVTGKVVAQAASYAGSVFTPAELKFLSLGVIKRRLASDLALDGSPYVAGPGEALPFMIIIANLPKDGLDFTAEVVSSEPLANKPAMR